MTVIQPGNTTGLYGSTTTLTPVGAPYGNANVASYLASGMVDNIVANNVTVTSNVTAGNLLSDNFVFASNGVSIFANAYSNLNVQNYLPVYSGNLGGVLTTATQPNIVGLGPIANLELSSNVNLNSFVINNSGTPIGNTDLTNKQYVDQTLSGLHMKAAVSVATAQPLSAFVYADGPDPTSVGVGATITSVANELLNIDGRTVLIGQRVLIKNELGETSPFNGIYVCTRNSVGTTYELTRATDSDVDSDFWGTQVYVIDGNANAGTQWVCLNYSPFTVGSTTIAYVNSQQSNVLPYTGGPAINIAGTTIGVNVDNTTITIDSSNQLVVIGGGGGGNGTNYSNANVQSYLPTYSGNLVSLQGPVITAGNITGNYLFGNGYFLSNVSVLSTPSLNIDNNLTVGGIINANSDVLISGNLDVTGTVNIPGNINQISGNSGQFFGNAQTGFGALYAGLPTGYANIGNTVLEVAANWNGYAQINFQNINGGNAASTDYILTNDVGTDTTNFVNLGIASSTYDGLAPNNIGNSARANDSYLYAQGNVPGAGGNLIIGTNTPTQVVRVVSGGSDTSNVVATFNAPNLANSLSVTGGVLATGNVQGANLIANNNIRTNTLNTGSLTATVDIISNGGITANGNVQGLYFKGDGSLLTGINANYGNANVAAYLASGGLSGNITTTGNITGDFLFGDASYLTNLPAGNYSNTNVSAYLNSGLYTGNVYGNNEVLQGNLLVDGRSTLTGLVNVTSDGVFTGNVTGNYFLGNGAFLTGISGGGNSVFTEIAAGTGINVTGGFGPIATISNNGVRSLNGEIGALSLIAGTGISITPAGTNITIATTGGSGVSSVTASSGVSGLFLTANPTTGAVQLNLTGGVGQIAQSTTVGTFGNSIYQPTGTTNLQLAGTVNITSQTTPAFSPIVDDSVNLGNTSIRWKNGYYSTGILCGTSAQGIAVGQDAINFENGTSIFRVPGSDTITFSCSPTSLNTVLALNPTQILTYKTIIPANGTAPSTLNDIGTTGGRYSTIYLFFQPDVSSDMRHKKNIQPATYGLDFIKQLTPVKYNLPAYEQEIDGHGNLISQTEITSTKWHYGFLAQDVKEIIGDADNFAGWKIADENDPDSRQSLAYGEFTAPLVKAVQELSTQLEAALARIAALEAK